MDERTEDLINALERIAILARCIPEHAARAEVRLELIKEIAEEAMEE